MNDEIKNEFSSIYADSNLDAFGLLIPERFTGAATDKINQGIVKILEHFSFPSLNLVFSVAGKLAKHPKNPTKVLVLRALLNNFENRVSIKPLDQDGRELSRKSLSILGLEPSATEVRTETTEAQGHSSTSWEYKPDISAIIDKIIEIEKDPAKSHERIPIAAIGMVASVAAKGLQLAFGSKKKQRRPKKTTEITQMASLESAHEFAWYLNSFGEVFKDGIHHGSAFLQVSKDVKYIEVTATVKVGWKYQNKISTFPHETHEFKKRIPVYHTKPPKTALITDFTSPSSIPIVIPRKDVRKLLSIEDVELEALIKQGKLNAYGENKSVITKGSLIDLLGI